MTNLRRKLREIHESRRVSYAVVRHFLVLRARAVLVKDARPRETASKMAEEALASMRPRARGEAVRLEKEFSLQ